MGGRGVTGHELLQGQHPQAALPLGPHGQHHVAGEGVRTFQPPDSIPGHQLSPGRVVQVGVLRDRCGHQPVLHGAVVGHHEQELAAGGQHGVLRVVGDALASAPDGARPRTGLREVDRPHLRGVRRDRPHDGQPPAAALAQAQLEARVGLLDHELVGAWSRAETVPPHLVGPVSSRRGRCRGSCPTRRPMRRRSRCVRPRRRGPRRWSGRGTSAGRPRRPARRRSRRGAARPG